jgi:hypothetical protein
VAAQAWRLLTANVQGERRAESASFSGAKLEGKPHG